MKDKPLITQTNHQILFSFVVKVIEKKIPLCNV